jgi:CRP-like cAMP-binding protein
LVAIGRQELLDQIANSQTLAAELLEQYVSNFIGATVHIHALEHSNSQERIIKLFHYLVLRFGVAQDDKNEVSSIPVRLTHTQIAGMVGLARETVTHGVMKLKRKGSLRYRGGMYTVNLPRLLKDMGSEEFDGLDL